MFKIVPILYKAKLDAETAEAQLAQLELNNTKRLFDDKTAVVSIQEVALFEAKLAKAQAKAKLAEAELNFTVVRAPFDGIIDRLHAAAGQPGQEGGRPHDLVRQQRDVGLFQRARGPLPRIHGRPG